MSCWKGRQSLPHSLRVTRGQGKDSTEPRRLHEMHGLDIKQLQVRLSVLDIQHRSPALIKLLQAGENHSAALTSFGEVYTWGRCVQLQRCVAQASSTEF